jgi:hypothetical protein
MDEDNDIANSTYDTNDDDDLLPWCSYIQTFDVCICTYVALQQDLSVARPPLVGLDDGLLLILRSNGPAAL